MNRSSIRRETDGSRTAGAGWAALALLAVLAGACSRGDDARKHAMAANASAPNTAEAALIARTLQVSSDSGAALQLGSDTMHVGPSATAFYKGRSWAPAWTSDGKMTDAGKALLAQLSRTSDDGLSPERYHYSTARRLVSSLDSGDDQAKATAAANLDVVLSEGFARYADDLAGGTLDPRQAGLEWHLPKERASKVQALQLIASGTGPDSVVGALRPHTIVYTRMMQALARYRGLAARGGWPMVGGPGTATSPDSAPDSSVTTSHARRGARAAATGNVAQVRARLLAGEDSIEAALAGTGRAAPATLDANLHQAIVHFQQRMGLDADGRIGPATVKALNVPVQDRMEALAVNMDRWRWLPRDLGPLYVMVNLPAFKVDVMRGDSAVMEQKVVVGKPGWTTPVFADRMVQLIVNPYWNVPKSIVAEELGPEMAKDPNYLAEHHFQPTSDGGYRQMPGPKNSLGLYKFQLTNDDDIYLHDTPQKDLFGKSDRDLSHGCIRLQDARAMAYFVGQQEGISQEAIDRARASGDNHVFDLKNPIPVYIMYFTAAVQADGSIAYYPDVYDIDAHMSALFPKLKGQPVDTDTVARDSAAVADSLKQVKASHVGKSTA